MMTPRLLVGLGALLVLIVGGSVLYERHRSASPAEQAAAHEQTIRAEEQAAAAETVTAERTAAAGVARVIYRTSRDTVLRHLTDTVLVRETISRADTVIARDSAAIVAAGRALALQQSVTMRMRDERDLALKPRYPPRLSGSASALYDPMAAVPAASASVNFRVIGALSLTARADQRFTPGEKPRAYVGISLAF